MSIVMMASGAHAAEWLAPTAAGPVHRAVTGHVTNYDEAKVGAYTLPDALQLANGARVTTAEAWNARRRLEILNLYQAEIFGRVPANAPAVHAEVVSAGDVVENGAGVRRHVVLHFGPGRAGPRADLVVYLPTSATARRPAPVLLQLVFLRGLPSETPDAPVSEQAARNVGATPTTVETAPVAEVFRRGFAYATFRYTDVQPDANGTFAHGVAALAYARGQTKPAPDEWGTIGIWAWAASRVLDWMGTVPELDANRVALIGHSRLGKTALWASAQDPRFALVFASCSGEMGAALSRRDFGETVDDMAVMFPYWFAGNFQKYVGHWDRMPVDAHLLIALSAPRPVFLTGGTEDQWADPKGEFLAAVAAGPVYRLLGEKDLGKTELPPVDRPLIDGKLGWLYHSGPHAILPADWNAFLDFADRNLKAAR